MMAFPLEKTVILIYLLLISSIGSSSDDHHTNYDGLRMELRLIRQEMGILREESQKQSTDIISLKETVQLQNKTITKHEITLKELDQEMKKSFNFYQDKNVSSEKLKRNKKPARLLPLQLLFDKDEDDDTTKKPPPRKFYGPPTNCSDLARLGYTLNGYYLVKHNYTETTTKYSYHSNSINATDTVYCAFKQEGTFNSSLVEKKLELSPPLNNKIIEELNQIFAKNGHLGESSLTHSTGKSNRDEDILELKREMTQLQHVVKDLSSPELDIAPYTCFAVQKLVNSNELVGNSVVRFGEEILNLGESFHLNESIFIAPKEGIYEFIFNGYKKGNKNEPVLKVSLRLNGKKVANSMADQPLGYHETGSNSVHNFNCPISMHSMLKLKKGDRIDVFSSQGSLHDHYSHYPIHFSGKLLFYERRKQKLPLLAVYSVLQKNTSFNTSNSVIPFEVESLNVGGAFDMKKNAFIVPVSGIYEFTLKGYFYQPIKPTTSSSVSLRLNGETMANSLADWHHDYHTPYSIYSILDVEKGDVVDIFLENGQIFDDDNQYNTFTGKLLSIDFVPTDKRLNYNINSILPSYSVLFNVGLQRRFSTPNEVLPFETSILITGAEFNMSKSVFKAPMEGIYEFSFAGIKTIRFTELLLSIALRLNGIPVTYASADAVNLYPFRTPFSLHSIMKMKEGDRVDLFLLKGGIHESSMDHYTHFTGKLLFTVEDDGNKQEKQRFKKRT